MLSKHGQECASVSDTQVCDLPRPVETVHIACRHVTVCTVQGLVVLLETPDLWIESSATPPCVRALVLFEVFMVQMCLRRVHVSIV